MKSFNIDGLKNLIDKVEDINKKQIPFATMNTLNNLAFSVMNRHKKQVSDGLKWKTKIPNAIKVKKAAKQNAKLSNLVRHAHLSN